jgi:hypothetical protein
MDSRKQPNDTSDFVSIDLNWKHIGRGDNSKPQQSLVQRTRCGIYMLGWVLSGFFV